MIAGLGLPVQAANIRLDPVPHPPQSETSLFSVDISDYVTTDFFLELDGQQWLGAQLYVNLTHGHVHAPWGYVTSLPHPDLLAIFPEIGFQTVINYDRRNQFVAGAAVDIDFFDPNYDDANRDYAPILPEHEAQAISMAWSMAPGSEPVTGFDVRLARLTLSDDAEGFIALMTSTFDPDVESPEPEYNFWTSQSLRGFGRIEIEAGHVVIPEPTAAVFWLLSTFGLIQTRRR